MMHPVLLALCCVSAAASSIPALAIHGTSPAEFKARNDNPGAVNRHTDIPHLTEAVLTRIAQSPAGVAEPILVVCDLIWCGRCRKLRQALQVVRDSGNSELKVFRLDIAQHSSLRYQLGVHRYPSLLLFRPGASPARFEGPSEPAAILAFVARVAESHLARLSTRVEVDTFLAKHPVVLLGCFVESPVTAQWSCSDSTNPAGLAELPLSSA